VDFLLVPIDDGVEQAHRAAMRNQVLPVLAFHPAALVESAAMAGRFLIFDIMNFDIISF
jgi:hypothetical protein